MPKREWVAYSGAVVAVIAGAVYIGGLEARVTSLENVIELSVERIREEISETLERARTEVVDAVFTGFVNPDNHTAPYTWRQGQRIRMLPVEEGLCFLAAVGGNFAGDREVARVEIVDGIWVLSGVDNPGRPIFAEARCWRFPQRP